MPDMVALTEGLPEFRFAIGDIVVREGNSTGGIWVLVSGELQVKKGDVVVNRITRPGALVGEVSVLLDTGFGATVVATEPSVMRYAADGRELLTRDPAITLLVAKGLAERLRVLEAAS